jgi:hypothetical protein
MLRVLKAKYLTTIRAFKPMNGFNKCPGGILMLDSVYIQRGTKFKSKELLKVIDIILTFTFV